MMLVFYIRLGASPVAAGFASTPGTLLLGLTFGLPLMAVAVLSVMLGAGVLPAEKMEQATSRGSGRLALATWR